MDHVLAAVLASLHADMGRMERVALNMANVQTAGYKREVFETRPFSAWVGSADSMSTVKTDQRPGTLRPTGQALDVALNGPGWFEVRTEQGVAYTRQGNFRLDAQGRVVTQQGHAVMGTGGEIHLLHGASPRIDEAGKVFDAQPSTGTTSAPLAQLKVVQFAPGAAMERLGDGLWHFAGDAALPAEGAVQVRQGMLENSNVSPMHEMVRLMEAMRHAESMQKVALGYDEMLATSIRRLGEGT
jgi:flagellar basal-body rod protein FlgF